MPLYCIGGDAIFYVLIPNATGSPVVGTVAMPGEMMEIFNAMNSITRLVYGLLSSLLLAAGFVRAADRFDPTNNSSTNSFGESQLGIAAPCTEPCQIVIEST